MKFFLSFILNLLLLAVRSVSSQQAAGCVPMWQADLTDPSVSICQVQTESGIPCQLPFIYNSVTYSTCTILGPNNLALYPQCLTLSNKWSNCTG